MRREEDDMVIDLRKDAADEHYWTRHSRKYGAKKKDGQKKRKYRFLGKGRLLKANTQYHAEIRKLTDKYAIRNIFLLTDSKEVLDEYRKMYGDRLIYTDCKRLTDDERHITWRTP